jgi:hypothetical protein
VITLTDRLKVDQIKSVFICVHRIQRNELKLFYEKFNPQLKETTFRWMLYELKKNNIISALDRGVFILNNRLYDEDAINNRTVQIKNNRKAYKPLISKSMTEIDASIRRQFPFITLCIWETSWLNEFMIHQPGKFLTIIEVESGTEEAVFYHIKKDYNNVYIKPTRQELDWYVYENTHSIVIKKLVSQAPLSKQTNITIPKMEKILVDLFAEKDFYYPYQGQELVNIYDNTVSSYGVSAKSLYRYADRRKCKGRLEYFLNKHKIFVEY